MHWFAIDSSIWRVFTLPGFVQSMQQTAYFRCSRNLVLIFVAIDLAHDFVAILTHLVNTTCTCAWVFTAFQMGNHLRCTMYIVQLSKLMVSIYTKIHWIRRLSGGIENGTNEFSTNFPICVWFLKWASASVRAWVHASQYEYQSDNYIFFHHMISENISKCNSSEN